MIILRLTPPSLEKRSPPIDSLIPSLFVGVLPPVQTCTYIASNHSSTYVEESFKESSEPLDFELVSERTLDCFSEAQFNHTVCIYHILIWDLLNSRSFIGETENIIQEFLSDWAFFKAQFNHTVFYLPYFKFVLLLKFQQLGFSFC